MAKPLLSMTVTIQLDACGVLTIHLTTPNQTHYPGTDCWCHPLLDENLKGELSLNGGVIMEREVYVHNSFKPRWG